MAALEKTRSNSASGSACFVLRYFVKKKKRKGPVLKGRKRFSEHEIPYIFFVAAQY